MHLVTICRTGKQLHCLILSRDMPDCRSLLCEAGERETQGPRGLLAYSVF